MNGLNLEILREAILDRITRSPIERSPLSVVILVDRLRSALSEMKSQVDSREDLIRAAKDIFETFPLPVPDEQTEAGLKAMMRPIMDDLAKVASARRNRKRSVTGLRVRNVVYELLFPSGEIGTLSKVSGDWFFNCPKHCVRIRGKRPVEDDDPYIPQPAIGVTDDAVVEVA